MRDPQMSFTTIHFIREILVTSQNGRDVSTMQTSDDDAACVSPHFKQVNFYQQDEVRAFYQELGGSRAEGERMGSTVVIPNRSVWASLRRVSPAEVQVIPSPDSNPLSIKRQPLL